MARLRVPPDQATAIRVRIESAWIAQRQAAAPAHAPKGVYGNVVPRDSAAGEPGKEGGVHDGNAPWSPDALKRATTKAWPEKTGQGDPVYRRHALER